MKKFNLRFIEPAFLCAACVDSDQELTRWVKKNIAEAVVAFPEKQGITLKCAHCGEDFEPKDLRHRRVAKYCGYSCAGKGRMDVIKKKKS